MMAAFEAASAAGVEAVPVSKEPLPPAKRSRVFVFVFVREKE